jgi:photosystem II stability/assembly factor-like uncharacterized protein
MFRGPRSFVAVLAALHVTVAALLNAQAAPARQRQQRAPARPAATQTGAAQAPDAPTFAQLRYRYIGPVGNRVTAVVGIPGDPNIYYAGAASGGIWKTTDAGIHWEPIFDDQPAQSIGALGLSLSDPNVLWAGTGEAFIRSHISLGNGIYKSTDAGRTWRHMGLDNTGRIGRVLVDPRNPDVVYACALGHAYGPQPERGVFRTRDGGATWDKVLFVNDSTGCGDLAMDANNPRILFAGMWQVEIKTWGRESGGPGSGLFVSRDGGTTWTRLTGRGLPSRPLGKVAVGIAQSNSNRVYALLETGDGAPWRGRETDRGLLWRSDDGGGVWRLVGRDRSLQGRAHYYSRFAIAPDDEDEVYFLTASFGVTIDGGDSLRVVQGGESPGGDNHDMWIDPTNADRMIVANDGQVAISTTHGRTWLRVQLPIAQMYHAEVDNQIPYFVYGNRQDGPSSRGPSNSKLGGFGGGNIPRGEWHSVAGGESGWATPDPVDPNIIWSSASGSGSVGGIVARYDERTRQAHHVEVWPMSTVGHPAADLKYRFIWTFPLTISPHDHNKVYVGSQHVHTTTDGGRTWQVISPDLTTNDKSRQQISGGLTPDNIGVEYGSTLFAIAESRLKPGVIWAGSNDGLVHVTQDGGRNWTNVTRNIPNLPPWGTISNIEASRFDTATAYLTVDFHQVNNRDPFVYKTTDYGRTWRLIVNGVPRSPLSYAHVIREDPVRKGLLYLGTENALYVSFNDGESWQPLQNNLPRAPVYWLVIQEHFNDLVVSTYGRGFWILDDLSPLQQLSAQVQASNAHLFAPRAAYRFRNITAPNAQSDDPTAGQNPPYGAAINYWLKSAPAGNVTLTIQDAQGQTVRTLTGTKNVGINRVYWDLRNELTREPRLRTPPLFASDQRLGPEGWRPAPGVGRLSVLMPPGRYTVKLRVGDQEFTQPLEVRKDPNSGGSEQEITTQTALLVDLQGDLNRAVDMINRTEVVRDQVQGLKSALSADSASADVRAAADSLERKFAAFEEQLLDLRVTGRGQDNIRWPVRVAGQIGYLSGGVGSSDFAPTTQQGEVHILLERQLDALKLEFERLMNQVLPQFNEMLRQRNIGNVVSGVP